jgi:hypothetical protein
MTNDSDLFLCLKLADKSYYSLYRQGEKGERTIVLTPAREEQEKSEISLFNCSGGRKQLLREILLENHGDMQIVFSLSHDYLSYEVQNSEGNRITEGLIELSEDVMDFYNEDYGSSKPLIREKRSGPHKFLLTVSVIVTLTILLLGGFTLARNLSQNSPPLLKTSGITPR